MITNDDLKRAVLANLKWFCESGVMDPADGSWGVAERIAVTDGNAAIEKMLESFPAWTMKDGYCVIEQRRADCNFQTAILFLLASKTIATVEEQVVAKNLFRFLYNRSGLLFTIEIGSVPAGVWQWSHIRQTPIIYFDDNAWCLLLQLALAHAESKWADEYHCVERALRLADALCVGMKRSFFNSTVENADSCDPEKVWQGDIRMPHWGSLACMALSAAFAFQKKDDFAEMVRTYCRFADENISQWNASELCYALIGASFACKYIGDDCFKEYVARLEAALLLKQDAVNGNFPSEHESEAPVGKNKVDTIYTVNWALLALQCAFVITCNPKVSLAKQKVMELLLKIQDKSPLPQFCGCWRGMFDLDSNSWGGGDRFEGGAGSIYTGWTNAPISLAMLFEISQKSLLDLC